MASHQRSTVRCPILLLLVAFGVALLILMPACAQDADLRDAAGGGDTSAVQALLNAGVDVNAKDSMGQTAIAPCSGPCCWVCVVLVHVSVMNYTG